MPLFQFLDLFLCTIGTLIVMLVIMTTKIRQDTINREIDRIVAKETEPTPVDPPEPAPLVTIPPAAPAAPDTSAADAHRVAISNAIDQLGKLEGRAHTLTAELAQRQQAITSLQQQANLTAAETQEASASKKELERRLREALANRNQELAELQQLRSEQSRLREQILESQKRLAAAKQREGNSEYVIVPYDGVTGTTRRPIIIECKGTTIRFVAEDVTVNVADMEPFRSGTDPVAAGIAELVQYWIGKASVGGPANTESLPYVLLVVRPSGLPSYLLTRRSLDATGIDFGYELVTEDFSYATPDTDARAKELCQAAVEQTIKDGPKAQTGRVFVLNDANRTGSGGGGASATRRSTSGRPPSGSGASGGPNRGGPSGSSTAGRSGSMRQYGGIDSGALSRGGTGSAKFFSSSSFLDHRDQIEVASSEPPSSPSRRKPGELQLSDDESPLIPTRAEAPAASPSPKIAGNIKPPAPVPGTQPDDSPQTAPARPASSEIEDLAPPPPKPSAPATAKTKSPSRSAVNAPSRTQGSDEETLEEQVPESPLMKDRDIKNLTSFKRQWGIHNPKGSIALEKKMPVALDGQRIIVGNRLKITRHEDRSNKQLADLTILAIDEVAKDWGPPPDQFYWVPTIDLSVYAGGELLIEPLQKSLKQTGVIVNVLYQ